MKITEIKEITDLLDKDMIQKIDAYIDKKIKQGIEEHKQEIYNKEYGKGVDKAHEDFGEYGYNNDFKYGTPAYEGYEKGWSEACMNW